MGSHGIVNGSLGCLVMPDPLVHVLLLLLYEYLFVFWFPMIAPMGHDIYESSFVHTHIYMP